jgi:hypothetical protein
MVVLSGKAWRPMALGWQWWEVWKEALRTPFWPGLVSQAYNPITWEAKTGRPWVWSHPLLLSEFQDSMGYTSKQCLNVPRTPVPKNCSLLEMDNDDDYIMNYVSQFSITITNTWDKSTYKEKTILALNFRSSSLWSIALLLLLELWWGSTPWQVACIWNKDAHPMARQWER